MSSLFSTWEGLFQYSNPKMPLIKSVATFVRDGENRFKGYLTELPLILPDEFKDVIDPKQLNSKTCWGSISCDVTMGELHDTEIPKFGRLIDFTKMPDQLSGYPVLCRGAFNEAAGKIIGRWKVVEGDTPCNLPQNLKSGNFTFLKDDGGRRPKRKSQSPVNPELLLV